MLYLFGNCQMDFLGQALEGLGIDAEHRPLASPLTLGKAGYVPGALETLERRFGIERYMHGRTLRNQFRLFDEADAPPRAVVVNLFHENQPLFSHMPDGRVFFIDPACWSELPVVETWMKASCQQIRPNPLRYLNRFTSMLERLSELHPGVPLLLVTRLFHYPAFGPAHHSYLEEWEQLQHVLPEALAAWGRQIPDLHVLDPNRVLGGLWSRAEARGERQRVEAHCPFLRIRLEPGDPAAPPQRMEVRRDLEHVGTLWPAMARKVADFLKHGAVRYESDEHIPRAWLRPWSGPERADDNTLGRWLASGSNYQAARAVAALSLSPGRSGWELLVEHAHAMPVCHNTLHMIDKYSRIQNNSLVAEWCALHAVNAERFVANGDLFRRQYIERLEQIASRATQTAQAA